MMFGMPKGEGSIIKVIGVGGGGSNAVTHMFKQGIVGVDFAISNTDIQAIETSPVPVKIQLGPTLTDGRGAGSRPQVGRQACIESIEEVKEFLEEGTKMLFVTAGMGGGTGTGGKYQSEKLDLQFASRDEVLCCRLTWKAGCRFQFRITRVARSKLVPHCKARFRH